MAGNDAASRGSRTASVRGRRRRKVTSSASAPASIAPSLPSSPTTAESKKKRKRRLKKAQTLRDFVPMGGTFSRSAEMLHSPSAATNPDQPAVSDSPSSSSEHDPSASDDLATPTMKSSHADLGNNRLAQGFPSKSRLDSLGRTTHDAIEISDSDSGDEMEDSEGGMVVNLVSSGRSEASDYNMDNASEDGEISHQFNTEPSNSIARRNSSDSVRAKVRLVDLHPADLEDQIRYAFYHLDRHRIDLHRPVICLACMHEGHMASDCPELNCAHCEETGQHSARFCPSQSRCNKCREKGHSEDACTAGIKVSTVPCDICRTLGHTEDNCPQRFFPQMQLTSTMPARLWISCCICASKTHLVGDCPDAPQSAASRWSLRSVNAASIINLSLQTGIRNLEREAENRGRRPPGLQIKGRAGLHRAGETTGARPAGDEDEPFLRVSVRTHQNRSRRPLTIGNYQSQHQEHNIDRYDRFAAPTSDRGYGARGRDAWYATDSFGQQRRSRSPRGAASGDTWRPGPRRSPSPRRFDGYRQTSGPPPSDYWKHQPANMAFERRAEPRSAARPPPPPSGDVQLQLPNRKGSNPNLPTNPMKNQASQPPHSPRSGQGSGQKKKGKPLKSTGTGPA